MAITHFELLDISDSTSQSRLSVVDPLETRLPPLRRPPSYSDSYYILSNGPRTPPELLSPLSLHTPPQPQPQPQQPVPVTPRVYLFFIKSAIHLLLISVFETVFFFQYVSVNENNGILDTLDTYYTPLVNTCPSWPSTIKDVIYTELTQDNTYGAILAAGNNGEAARAAANRHLLEISLVASGVCLAVVVAGSAWLKYKQIPVRWTVVFAENCSMVVLLGLYEYMFFRFIIYKYATLSTSELNAYLVKGIYDCCQPATTSTSTTASPSPPPQLNYN